MILKVRKSDLKGEVEIPASKSHTIRAVVIAALAQGSSVIRNPLVSADTESAVAFYRGLGAEIDCGEKEWKIKGVGGKPTAPDHDLNVGNSGTTLRIGMGSCALLESGYALIDGDEQVTRRPTGALAKALTTLGASIMSVNADGCAPFEVYGRIRGGHVAIDCPTSQYLTSLLMATPLADGESDIEVTSLFEKPYVTLTLDWLSRQGIKVEYEDDYSHFWVRGHQAYSPVDRTIPGDFSSATFFLAAGGLGNNDILCKGISMRDHQGDKDVVGYLQGFGARTFHVDSGVRVSANCLQGFEIDLNGTPDTLPMMAALACFAESDTELNNVPQARSKETDRIAVMAQELTKMGAKIKEREDGLKISPSKLKGTHVNGHGDHRIVMALAIAGTQAEGETVIDTAEAMNVTYPEFVDHLKALGGDVTIEDDDASS